MKNMSVLPLGVTSPPLPRGRRDLTRDEVISSQRGRMLLAIAHAVADKGYAATTVADVLGRARVSRGTFYEHFADKEECFAAAYDTANDVLAAEVMKAAAGAQDDLDAALRAAMRSYCSTLAADLPVARALILEIGAAGPAVRARRAHALAAWADLLEAMACRAAERDRPRSYVPPWAGTAAVGAVTHLLETALDEGRDLEALADDLADTAYRLLLVARDRG